MLRKLLGFVLAITVISFIAPSFVSATGNMKIGPIKVDPYISGKATYTTNVFATSGAREDDYIITYTPGVTLKLPFRRHLLYIDYNIVDKNYEDFSDEDTTSQNGYGMLDLKVGSKLNVILSDTYTKGHEPRGASATGSIEKFKSNTMEARIRHALVDTSSVEFAYSGTELSYETAVNDFRERDEDTLSFGLYFKVLPKTSLFVEYARKDVNYEVVEPILGVFLDSRTDFMQMGVKWDATGKSTGILKVGYAWKDYDDDLLGEYNTWVGSLEGIHNIDKDTSLTLRASRSLNETSLSGTRFTTITGAYGELRHKFFKRYSLAAKGSKAEVKFSDPLLVPTELRIDNMSTVGADFVYKMQKDVTLTLDYEYSKRNSNEDVNDYRQNLYSVTASFKF